MNMTFIILFFISGFNILLSQQNCFNLDFVDHSWYRKDSVVSVEKNSNDFELIINNRIIKYHNFDGEIIDFKIYDIIGKNIPFTVNKTQSKQHILINKDLIKSKLILITFSTINKNGIKYYTIKQVLD